MDHIELRDHIDSRLDRIESQNLRVEGKLDSHLERISKAEEAIIWIKGHIKIVVMLGMSAISGLAAAIWKLL